MKSKLLIAAIVSLTIAAELKSASLAQQPPEALARIIVPESDGFSYGSGSLIAVNESYGLVVTNWHVVRDAAGQVWVAFPSGFRSPASIWKTDSDWDLAALLILKPNIQPLPVSTQAPQLGERLTIAGYGNGFYRAVSGQCTNYFSPNDRLPREIVELSIAARRGDSGGPILNDRGEIAGVLFGSDDYCTMGSYCGRLRNFLSPLGSVFERLPPPSNAWAQARPPIQSESPRTPIPENEFNVRTFYGTPIVFGGDSNEPKNRQGEIAQVSPANVTPQDRQREEVSRSSARPLLPVASIPGGTNVVSTSSLSPPVPGPQHLSPNSPPSQRNVGMSSSGNRASINGVANLPMSNAANSAENSGKGEVQNPLAKPSNVANFGESSPLDQVKSFLAVIGVLALFIQGLKIFGKAAG